MATARPFRPGLHYLARLLIFAGITTLIIGAPDAAQNKQLSSLMAAGDRVGHLPVRAGGSKVQRAGTTGTGHSNPARLALVFYRGHCRAVAAWMV